MNRTLLLLWAAVLASCAPAGDEVPMADIAFVNGKVYTVNEAQPWAEAVLIKDNVISYVGDSAGAATHIGDSTRVWDISGQLLLPGFIDAHSHPIDGGTYAAALSLDTYEPVERWLEQIREYAAAHPDDEILFGYGFLATTFGPPGPRRELIDAIVPDRPVLIMDEGFHAAWANTAALKALNITQDTPDPVPGFSYYKRDDNGDATGYLLENTAYMAMDSLDVITVDLVLEGLRIIFDTKNSFGVTATFDAGLFNQPQLARPVLEGIDESGGLSVRLVGSWLVKEAEHADAAVDTIAELRQSLKGHRYHVNTLKIMNDGTVEGRTAAMFEDYQGEPGNSGNTVFTEEQLVTMISGAASRNIDVHVHSLGERAIHETLNAIETARNAQSESETRYTICHVQVITDQDVSRFAELDVMANSTPLWASYDEYGRVFVSEDQFDRFWRFKSLEDAGARLTFGSDFPATGLGAVGLSPLVQIEIGHTRQYHGEPDSPVQPLQSERLGIESLVRGFTINAAYQLHMEDEIGSIEVGKKADLVVLDRDIFEIDPYSIHSTNVLVTMLDGEIVYEAGESQ